MDTSLGLRRFCRHVKKVYAFEPDPHNYEVCLKVKEKFHFSEAKIIPFGTWSENTTLLFYPFGNDCSCLCKAGIEAPVQKGSDVIEVPVMPIDDAIEAGDRVTTIKMDVEGAEEATLLGCRDTIAAFRPMLSVAAYHRSSDLYRLPHLIWELNPGYRLYLRRHKYIPAWEIILYAVQAM